MAVLCARLSEQINAVSLLHREVTEQRVLGRLWPGRAAPVVRHQRRAPQNLDAGVDGRALRPARRRRTGTTPVPPPGRAPGTSRTRSCGAPASDCAPIWSSRAVVPAAASGAQGWGDDLDWARQVLDPAALTVVVARRAAEYKEPDLLVSMPRPAGTAAPRHRALRSRGLSSGRAHPADSGGKERIRRIVEYSLARRGPRPAWSTCPGTTCAWRSSCSPARTSGSTTRGAATRRAGPAS